MAFNPATTNALTNLTLGGYLTGNIWVLHSRLRYFDPVARRSGLPADVSALVERLTPDEVTVTLVNINPVEPRAVTVQAGAYAEHQFVSASLAGQQVPVGDTSVAVRLDPGAGARLELRMKRYVNRPSLSQPWDRGWMPPN
jgi:hypothetical protein